jgi:hypothetical protein
LEYGPVGDTGQGAGDVRGLDDIGLDVAAGRRRIWTVISRDTSDCQSTAAARTSMTAPVVNDAERS